MSKLAHSNDETMRIIEENARNLEEPNMPDTLVERFQAKAKNVNLKDGPQPGGKSEEWLKGQRIGIAQGLKIAESIIAEIERE